MQSFQDDLDFGASVWASSSDLAPISVPFVKPPDTLDESEFGATVDAASVDADDDFGDFGDFGEGQGVGDAADFSETVAFGEEVRKPAANTADWEPLRLDPIPSRSELHKQVNDILGPIWADDDISQVTTDEEIREVEGISRILVTPESREVYKMIVQDPPPTKPPDWKRSRIRREHLIALGIPVNLDEMVPHANGKPLPPLQISTRPMSAPPGPRHQTIASVARGSASRVASPDPAKDKPGSSISQLTFGTKPEIDENKISELLALDTEELSLLPLAALENHLTALRTQTVGTSNLLSFLLQKRETLQQDSETYNGLIAELVGEAQKIKTGKGKATSRRGVGMT